MYYWVHNDFPLPSLQPFYCLFWFCDSAWVLQEPTMLITQTCTHIQTHTHAHIIAHRRRKTTPGIVFVKSLSLVRCRFCFFSFSFFLLHTSPFPSFLLLSAIPSLFLLYSVFLLASAFHKAVQVRKGYYAQLWPSLSSTCCPLLLLILPMKPVHNDGPKER